MLNEADSDEWAMNKIIQILKKSREKRTEGQTYYI